ncbi:hypothetical protein L228DRAFT_142458 [Xylona heveae TC161]|uniref:Zn(2)-C6 fungal-type domain-containing protein n=1 Tax=Xylona heveae (strain CBS 132557 / TC161) TaxID=1328760 RepID=A0A165H6Q1_XYLHT|nr:hypothetical protein L228DRAFT_142458 [Xylona heveae TC161]KZF23061.1 hypothetical protein L228DRAFT_142458 [Xylona heveae TC161]
MNETSSSHSPRTHQACEPCRRKKTKCPGERPICSFCWRLNQSCKYVQKDSRHRASREAQNRRSSKGRVRRLESQVGQILETIQTLTDGQARELPRSQTYCSQDVAPGPIIETEGLLNTSYFDTSTCPLPPNEVLIHFVQVYKTKLHLQPLQLFNISTLPNQVTHFPDFLLYSLLAIGLHFSDHEFYKDKRSAAIQFYVRSARDIVIQLATEGKSSLELLQSLCLLALADVADCRLERAWVTIGIASRLAICPRSLKAEFSPNPSTARDNESRCFWSVMVLERTFCSGAATANNELAKYSYPCSIPNPIIGTPAPTPPIVTRDLGINAYCIQLLSVWCQIISYTKQMKCRGATDLGLSTSTYQQLMDKFYKFEASFPLTHGFKHTAFHKRTSTELSDHFEYWTAWLLLQVTYHTAHALLNHPIIYIVPKHLQGAFQSPAFLQQTVDQALLHSGWVAYLFRICNDLQFETNNPFLGHLASVTATVHWLFQFAGDLNIVQKARANLVTCQEFLERMSAQWPHLSCLVQKLRILQESVPDVDTLVNQPSIPLRKLPLYWELLDHSLSMVTLDDVVPDTGSTRSRVTTEYLVSLNDNPVTPVPRRDSEFVDSTVETLPEDLHYAQLSENVFGEMYLSHAPGMQLPTYFNFFGHL